MYYDFFLIMALPAGLGAAGGVGSAREKQLNYDNRR